MLLSSTRSTRLQRVEQPADGEQRAVRRLQHRVEGGGDRRGGARQRVDARRSAAGRPAGTRRACRVGRREPRQHLRDMRGRAARPSSSSEPLRTTSSRSSRPSRSKKTASTAARLVRAPELAEEAEAPAGRQDVVALEVRHLDLAQRQVLGGVGEDRRAGRQRHRPALREEPAGVGRGDDLDEAVALGGGGDEAAGEGAVRPRLGRVAPGARPAGARSGSRRRRGCRRRPGARARPAARARRRAAAPPRAATGRRRPRRRPRAPAAGTASSTATPCQRSRRRPRPASISAVQSDRPPRLEQVPGQRRRRCRRPRTAAAPGRRAAGSPARPAAAAPPAASWWKSEPSAGVMRAPGREGCW